MNKNIEEWTLNDYLTTAQKCMDYSEYDMALKYYKEALKLEPEAQTAKFGIERARKELQKLIYFETPANFKMTSGKLELRLGMLVFVSSTSAEIEYEMEYLDNFRVGLGRLIFDYKGRKHEGYSCSAAKRWVKLLQEVKEGKYPGIDNRVASTVEKYIMDNFNKDSFEDAVDYFMEITECPYSDARIAVRRLIN